MSRPRRPQFSAHWIDTLDASSHSPTRRYPIVLSQHTHMPAAAYWHDRKMDPPNQSRQYPPNTETHYLTTRSIASRPQRTHARTHLHLA